MRSCYVCMHKDIIYNYNKNMKKYPKTIYVQIENDGTKDILLIAVEKTEEILYDDKVAIYELKEIKTKKTKITIE